MVQRLIAFDGMVDFWVRILGILRMRSNTPCFGEVVKDEERVIDRAGVQMMVGWEVVSDFVKNSASRHELEDFLIRGVRRVNF